MMVKEKWFNTLFFSFLILLVPFANVYLFGNYIQPPRVFTQSFTRSTECKETMEAMVFFSAHPGELRLVKNIHLIFEDVAALPINTSILALNDRFLELDFKAEAPGEGGNTLYVSFSIFFESTIDNETANAYTDDIVKEFFNIFGFNSLKSILGGRIQAIRDGKLWVSKAFGYLPLTTESFLDFLKFAPKNGFGVFVNGLVNKYLPALTVGLYPCYSLKKVGSNFCWNFVITGATSDLLPWDVNDYPYVISLKELLNTNLSIVENPSENQQIIVMYEKNHTELLSKGLTIYTIDICNVQPEGYTVSPSTDYLNHVEIRYEQLFPMEDVVVEMELNSFQNNLSQKEQLLRLVIATIVTLAIFLLFLFYIAKKYKRR